MKRGLLILALLLLALAALGCERTADLIPGSDDDESAESDAPATATTEAQPVLPPASLDVSGGRTAPLSDSSVPDATLASSVVQILVLDESVDPPVVRDGSGVVIDTQNGLILTSSHVVDPFQRDATPRYTSITIATSAVPGGEPRPTHRAVLAAIDPGSELAILRVTELIESAQVAGGDAEDGSSEDEGETGGPLLGLPAAVMGDPSALKRGDQLRIFGHPGLDPSGAITPQSVLVTTASMTGARGDPVLGDRAWIKTDARLPHGSAGGPVFNASGELVGIAAQIAYNTTAPVAHVRPVQLATQIIAEANLGDAESVYIPPLAHAAEIPGTGLTARDDSVAVSEPLFALEAIEEGGERDLFDYARVFPSRLPELQYEFVAQGISNGANVQEFWYLDGVFQDELSSTYNWASGPFAVISDRLATPNPAGNPDGIWTLEVWVDGELHASGQAFLGVQPPSPTAGNVRFASELSVFDVAPADEPTLGDPRLLAFFDYQGAAAVERLRWVVYRDGAVVYRSPNVPWRGGNSGTWWVGVPLPDGLDAGAWEVQIWFDDENIATDSFELAEPTETN